jgi:arsenite oxidase large subunit
MGGQRVLRAADGFSDDARGKAIQLVPHQQAKDCKPGLLAPDDMEELGVKEGDLVEVFNDDGSTQAMVYPTASARKGETFMLFAFPTSVMGNVINDGVNEFIIPNYKQTWADIRKISDAPEGAKHLTFKSQEYSAG